MLHRNAHAKVVDLLDEKLRKTVSGYKKRSFGEEMDVRCQQLMRKVEERRQQLQKEGKDSEKPSRKGKGNKKAYK